MKNIDIKTVKSFGDEWEKFNQEKLMGKEYKYLFDLYLKMEHSFKKCERI